MDKEWLWVDASTAAALALKQDVTLEILRKGYGYLGPEQFAQQLGANDLRIIIFKNKSVALTQIVSYADGLVMNILTVKGDMRHCEEAIKYLELAAKEVGANLIVSVGHAGWARVMKRQGYEIEPRLLMRKVLK